MMPLAKRRSLLATHALAAAATVIFRGRARMAAWAAHEILRLAPTLIRNTDWHGPVAKRFVPNGHEVWLTIDDGPDPEQTPQLLDLLADFKARASFFVIGKKVDENRALCRRVAQEGHSLENHTYTHPSGFFWALPCCAIRSEMVRCSHAIRVAAGVDAAWFRSPAGMTNACVHPAAARSWLRVAGWSADGVDGLPRRHPASVVQRIMSRVEPGAIILMHDGGKGRRSAEVLELLLQKLTEEGYRCVIPKKADVN